MTNGNCWVNHKLHRHELHQDKAVFITHGNNCSADGHYLANNQEEAVTKMFLFMNHVFSQGFQSSCIVTVDAHAGILSLYYSAITEGNVYQSPSRIKVQNQNIRHSKLRHWYPYKESFARAPFSHRMRLHSSFYEKGKVKALKAMKNKQGHFKVRYCHLLLHL